MSKYKVKTLGVQGLNKKVFQANEIVSDSNFPEGMAAELVKKGALNPLDKSEGKRELEERKKRLTEAQKNLEVKTKIYNDALKEIRALETKRDKEKRAEKIKELDLKIEKASENLKEFEVNFNDARGAVKKIQ
ncbi:hypothetical protein ES705_25640 [subsurface metagenome]